MQSEYLVLQCFSAYLNSGHMSGVLPRSGTHYWFMTLSLATLTVVIDWWFFVLFVWEDRFLFSPENNLKGNAGHLDLWQYSPTPSPHSSTTMPVGLALWLQKQWHFVGFSCTELQSHFTGLSQIQVSFPWGTLLLTVYCAKLKYWFPEK